MIIYPSYGEVPVSMRLDKYHRCFVLARFVWFVRSPKNHVDDIDFFDPFKGLTTKNITIQSQVTRITCSCILSHIVSF